MYDFGKLTSKRENIDENDPTSPLVYFMYDSNGVEWHSVFRAAPKFDFYVAVDDKGAVVSAEPDPEHSQIPGFRILGLSTEETGGYTRGPGGTIYGKVWNGTVITEPVLTREEYPTLTPRQLWLAAATINITKDQVLALVDTIEDETEKAALRIEITETVSFERSDPAMEQMASLLNIPPEQLDALWLWAANVQA